MPRRTEKRLIVEAAEAAEADAQDLLDDTRERIRLHPKDHDLRARQVILLRILARIRDIIEEATKTW